MESQLSTHRRRLINNRLWGRAAGKTQKRLVFVAGIDFVSKR
jgi:hypothetical protein